MEPLSPELVLVAPPEERARILASLPDRDPYAFLHRPLQDASSDTKPPETARPLILRLAAYLLLEIAGVLLFGAVVIGVLVAVLAIVELVGR